MRSLIKLILAVTTFLAVAAFMFISCGGGSDTVPKTVVDGAFQENLSGVPGSTAAGTPVVTDRLDNLTATGDRAEGGHGAGLRSKWEGIRERIEAAVEAGEMTREEADAKYQAIREDMGNKRWHGEGLHAKWEGGRARIEAAVEAGEMTREEADAKYEAIKGRMGHHRGDKADWNWDNMLERIEDAVESGKLTREEADEKLTWMREGMGRYNDADGYDRENCDYSDAARLHCAGKPDCGRSDSDPGDSAP